MKRWVVVAAGLLLAGCSGMDGVEGPRVTAQAGSTLAPRPDDVEATLAGWGRVRANPAVLAEFLQPLWAAPDPNRTVEPCRLAVEAASLQEGPSRVEAASRGPELRTRDGLIHGAVEVRILHKLDGVTVVRQAALLCTVRADGSFVTARVYPEAEADRP
ncbi:MAG TPA: hypothetical protein VGU45_16615 [Microvirga sp.]|jgi:hypothetical protein|nr:hypothetical protein [Microvirga sp.]